MPHRARRERRRLWAWRRRLAVDDEADPEVLHDSKSFDELVRLNDLGQDPFEYVAAKLEHPLSTRCGRAFGEGTKKGRKQQDNR